MLWFVLYVTVALLMVTIGLIHVYQLCYENSDESETETEPETEPSLLPRKRRLHFSYPLPRRQFRGPEDVEPLRTKAGTLIPLVVHVFSAPHWDAVAQAWQQQGWSVCRWPQEPQASLVRQYFGDRSTLKAALWPYLIVYDQGGLFTTLYPSTHRSLKHYLIYTGFNATSIFFADAERRLSAQVLAAQHHHPSLKAVLEGQSWEQTRAALQGVRMLDQATFMYDPT